MINGYYNGVAGLRVAELTQEIVANNLANAETAGFKASRPFVEALDSALGPAPSGASAGGSPQAASAPQPRLAGQGLDFSVGPMRSTGRALDIAIEGDDVMAVATPGGTRYTRDGRLTLDADGTLVTLAGHPIQGESGPIVVQGNEVRIDEDGSLIADGVEVGRIQLLRADPTRMTQEGAGMFTSSVPLAPSAEGRVRPRFVEGANVDPVQGTVDLIETLRRFEAIAKANQLLMGDMTKTLYEEAGRGIGR